MLTDHNFFCIVLMLVLGYFWRIRSSWSICVTSHISATNHHWRSSCSWPLFCWRVGFLSSWFGLPCFTRCLFFWYIEFFFCGALLLLEGETLEDQKNWGSLPNLHLCFLPLLFMQTSNRILLSFSILTFLHASSADSGLDLSWYIGSHTVLYKLI